ncbi:(2Fe-2S)-binding protein [Nocardia rhizosphaerae]|uniref:(2Fe-2S)-binding protein n=1 Tax=Nocardia rhizosphaerae TaxID=1691571 RepID=A0ABV8L7R3_9NOCA
MSTVPGRLLTDPGWLTARIGEMSRAWGTDAERVGGTLWWCMVASALVEEITRAYAAGAPAPLATLDELDCEVRPDGGIEHIRCRSTAAADSADAVGVALRDTLAAVVPQVAAVSGAGMPALWAVVADAIGNRALDAGATEAATRLAAEVGGRLPAPRFVTIGTRTVVQRISCCLVYEVPGCQMCTSCPKRPREERAALLAEKC